MKLRKGAEELRGEAAKESDPVLREMLLNAAIAFEQMAAWKPHKHDES